MKGRSMFRNLYKVLLADVALLIAFYGVASDLAWKGAYAASPHANVAGYSPSMGYGLFTQVFSMTGGPIVLTSPLTLSWLEVITVSLILLNLYFGYRTVAERRMKPEARPTTSAPLP